MNTCLVCSARDVEPEHFATEKHKKNSSLKQFALNKSQFVTNRKGVAAVFCDVKSSFGTEFGNKDGKIKISAKPNEKVEFTFLLSNESSVDDLLITYIQLVHKQFNFVMANNPFGAGSKPRLLTPRSKLSDKITVTFSSPNIGQYETPILFYFVKKDNNENVILMREMVVFVEGSQTVHDNIISPYERKGVWAKELIKSASSDRCDDMFQIPKNCKQIYATNLKLPEKASQREKDLSADIRKIFSIGITKENYIKFFHNVLWYEETIIRVNIKKYNMSGVQIVVQHSLHGTCYKLEVPGLGEKRPSLMLGDLLFIKPHNQNEVMFGAIVKEINDSEAIIGDLHPKFSQHYRAGALFDVRFFMSRVPLERMHHAVHAVFTEGHECRIFPKETNRVKQVKPIVNFFNPLVEGNLEQRCAVERIVSGTADTAPYLLHGPPGTGKTVTIVEAVLQLVLKDPSHRIMVCTDSNSAADHVATMLIKYAHMFKSDAWLLRANSKFRVWETLPECLVEYSNGSCRANFEPVDVEEFITYNIVITTLSHAAKFARQSRNRGMAHHITHLFIDEAAQASEPACLIPVCGLLRPRATLVLAGDPHQLGPVVISHNAANIGLGTSLMERLKKTCPLYSEIRNDPNYIVMLRNNFRSNPDIIEIPDRLFYKGQLRALAKEDRISNIDILGEKQHSRAVVFHGVLSKEQKIGKSPSYFNMLECEIVQLYVRRLVTVHNVAMQDIGIVTPYIRQVYQIKKLLKEISYDKIEVGTVEAYQGKEKRIIIISTVRANCNLLDHDAKFQLGFLVDDKRFNVAITRAKAKVIIIGNPLCLEKDIKWRMYMQRCRELGTYHGFDSFSLGGETLETVVEDIVGTITPMLQNIKIAPKKRVRRKKTQKK
nr:putative helicase mov-10-B.2 isoform X1 [Helicoverpa armigera]